MQHRASWTSAAAACAVALALLPGARGPVAAAPAAVAATHPPRVAFTSDRDEPGQWEVTRSRSAGLDRFGGVPVLPDSGRTPGPVHDGETSYTQVSRGDGATVSAYVSTAGGESGDVYVSGLPGTEQPLRVTCDDAVETHPVVSPDGTSVAYASNVSGAFRIWVARLVDVRASCDTMPRYRLTDGPGQDLWPSWAPSGDVVFGSTRDDPLGDLYAQGLPGEAGPSPVVRLTDDPAADTQPSVGYGPLTRTPVVAFTTTRFRPDGSVAFLALPPATAPPTATAEAARVPVARSGWAADPPQSSEPALAPGGTAIAYTGTEADPYGDVWVGSLTGSRTSDLPAVAHADPVAAQPGVAESHGTWAGDFRTGYAAPDTAVAQLVVTRRSLDAGIADVVAADGSGRRTVAAAAPGGDPAAGSRDPATPAYSPDGTRIAYSREIVAPPGTADFGREIVVARADGSEVSAPAVGRRPGDVDLRPSWSPDGTKLAFIRTLYAGEGYLRPRVWVADLATGEARAVGLDPPRGEVYHDETVSWSPDGTRLAIGRHVVVQPDLAVTLTADPTAVQAGETTTVTAVIRNTGRGAAAESSLGVGVGAGLVIVGAAASCVISAEGTWVDCDLGTVAPGGSARFAFTVRADLGGTHTAAAYVSTASDDLDPQNNSDTATVDVQGGGIELPPLPGAPPPGPPVPPNPPGGPPPGPPVPPNPPGGRQPLVASLTVVPIITTSPPVVAVGGAVRLAVTLADTGLAVGASVRLVIRLPQGLVVTAVVEGCVVLGQEVTCEWDRVPPGGLPTVLLEARVTVPGLLAVTATVAVWLPNGAENSLAASVALVVVVALPIPLPALPPITPPRLPPLLPPGLPPIVPPGLPPILPPDLGPGVPPILPPGLIPVEPPDLSPVLPPGTPGGAGLPLPVGGTRPPEGVPRFSVPQIWTVDAGTGTGAALRATPPRCAEDPCAPVPVPGRSPAWSPEGLRLAYDESGAIRIAVLADTDRDRHADVPESVTRVTAVTGFDADGRPTPSRRVLSVAEDPAWSPDGSRLAVTGQPAGQPDQRGIYTLRPDGTGLGELAQQRGPETEPAWQPYARLAVTLTADPTQFAPPGTTALTATVTNGGPAPAGDTSLTLDVPTGLTVSAPPVGCTAGEGQVVCPFGTLPPDGKRTVDLVASGTEPATYVVTATATTGTPDDVAADGSATVTVFVVVPGSRVGSDLLVSVAPSADPAYVGATNEVVTIAVTNRGPEAAPDVSLTTTYPDVVTPKGEPPCTADAATCPLGELAAGETRTLTVPLAVLKVGDGPITAGVTARAGDPDTSNNQVTVPLTVRQPRFRLLPSIGEPGFVTLAYGQDFPPNAEVSVAWDRGVTAVPGPFTVAPDGTIRIQVLVIRRDEDLGKRVLVVSSDAGDFGPVQQTMLVVPRSTSVNVPAQVRPEAPILGRD